MTYLPQAAIDATRIAIARLKCVQAGWAFGVPVDGQDEWLDEVVAAAAQLIAAAERERIRQLAIEHGAVYAAICQDPDCIGDDFHDHPFDELLQETR
jgi:hypothetical protein